MDTEYIKPRLYLSNSFDDLLSMRLESPYDYFYDSHKASSQIEIEDILQHKLAFIVAEPGQGKTRLIDELENIANGEGISCQRFNFRTKLPNQSIEDWLKPKGISSSNQYIFFDGLDESPSIDVGSTIHGLIALIENHPNVSFVISSRLHYFNEFKATFSQLSQAKYIFINALDRRETRKFLRSLNVDNGVITSLFQSFSQGRNNDSTVLQNPRYLEMIAKTVKDASFDTKNLNRSFIFEAFIKDALKEEDNKSLSRLAEYKQRFLENLALTMAIAQVKEISSDDFITFLDMASSDVKLMLSVTDLETIYDHALLIKDEAGKIRFYNPEVQEYLASKYITRMANPVRKTFSLAFDSNTRSLIPIWRNIVLFVLDELPEIARLIVNQKENQLSIDESTELLVTGVTSNVMSAQDKGYIFDYIWNNHRSNAHFIDREVSLNLSRYANADQISQIVSDLCTMKNTKNNKVNLLNTVIVCGNFIALNLLDIETKKVVTDRLLSLSRNRDTTLQYNAIDALSKTNDADILDKLIPLADNHDDNLFGAVQSFAYDIDKNSAKAINLYIKGMKRDGDYISRMYINELDSIQSIDYFLSKMADDRLLVRSLIEHDKLIFKEESQLIDSIKRYWQNSWLKYLKKFVLSSILDDGGYYGERSEFVKQIVSLISSNDSGYFGELLDYSDTLDEQGVKFLYRLNSFLANIIPVTAVEKVVEKIKSMKNDGWALERMLASVEYSNNPDKDGVSARARELMPEYFAEADKSRANTLKKNRERSLSYRFRTACENIENDLVKDKIGSLRDATEIFISYNENSNHNELLEYSEEQLTTVWTGWKKAFLDGFDPDSIEFSITDKTAGRTSYRISNSVYWASKALVFGYLSKRQDLSNYKVKILRTLPYMYEQQLHDITDALTLNDNDINLVIDAYRDVSSDIAVHLPTNFIKFANTYSVTKAVPILQKFILESDIPDYDKTEALKASENILPDKKFLRQIVDSYLSNPTDNMKSVFQEADGMLIVKHQDKDAIKRRLKLLVDRASDCPAHKSRRAYAVSADEHEINHKDLAKPLMGLTDVVWKEYFLKLLSESFEIYQKDGGWRRYSTYLWEVCTAYFKNISHTKDTKIVREIEEAMSHYSPITTADFIRFLDDIRETFLNQISEKPRYISAINLVNKIHTIDDFIVSSYEELEFEIEDILKELDRWVSQEGTDLTRNDETDAQINIAHRLDNLLLRKYGNSDVKTYIVRETQAVDGTRTDFYAYHGFIGPVLIELKLSRHQDLNSRGDLSKKESFKSMQKYMHQFNAKKAIFLIYKCKSTAEDKDPDKFTKIKNNAIQYYESIEGVRVRTLGE